MPRSLQTRTKSHSPSQTQQVQVQTSLGQSIKQGFGFGMGSHLANWILGPAGRQNPSESKPIYSTPTEYKQCMSENNDDKAACAHLLQKA
jgi:hypothetical protein